MYLSFTLQSVDSIKSYCATVCDLNELKGYPLVRRGKRFYKVIRSLRQILQHEVRQAQPMTVQLLKKLFIK